MKFTIIIKIFAPCLFSIHFFRYFYMSNRIKIIRVLGLMELQDWDYDYDFDPEEELSKCIKL